MDATAITSDCTLERAYAEGRSDEREQWLPLAGELSARILHKHQPGGALVLTLEDVLAISCELKRAERRTA